MYEYQLGDCYSILVSKLFSCTFCEIVSRKIHVAFLRCNCLAALDLYMMTSGICLPTSSRYAENMGLDVKKTQIPDSTGNLMAINIEILWCWYSIILFDFGTMVEVYLLENSGNLLIIKVMNKQKSVFAFWAVYYFYYGRLCFVRLTWKSYHGANSFCLIHKEHPCLCNVITRVKQ